MLEEIVRKVLSREPDLEVVGAVSSIYDLDHALAIRQADVVVAGLAGSSSGREFDPLLRAYSRLRVFSLEGDGRRTVLHEMRPHSVPLGNVTPEELIDAIRTSVEAVNH